MMTRPDRSTRDLLDTIAIGVQERSHGRVRKLHVELDGRLVVLRGETASYHAKQLAQSGALAVIDDRQLVNEIVVI